MAYHEYAFAWMLAMNVSLPECWMREPEEGRDGVMMGGGGGTCVIQFNLF